MPLTAEQLADMADRGVIVLDRHGEVISLGRLVVTPLDRTETAPRVELIFEIERWKGSLRITGARLDDLAHSWDGTLYRYRLPEDDAWEKDVWPAGAPRSMNLAEP